MQNVAETSSESPEFQQGYADFWQENWGVYPHKPACQEDWESQVKKAVLHIDRIDKVAANQQALLDTRPRVFDVNSKSWYLVDSGAAVSVVPRRWYPRSTPDAGRALQAVNGTRIPTYGVKHVTLRLGHNYSHTFVVSDVEEPVLGFGFLQDNHLDLRWLDNGQCQLYHARKPAIPLKLGPADPLNLGLALVSFKDYSDARKIKDNLNVKPAPVPPKYQELLDKYPGIQEVTFNDHPRHQVCHSIETGENAPCMAKPRPILPGSPKAVKGEKTLLEMEKVGILQRIGPNEPMLWSNPLHLVNKPDGSLRVCGDYRKLNTLTKLDLYPLPNLRHFAAKLKGAKHFSKVDLARAYYLIPLTEATAPKTTIATPWGAFKFKRLSMGMRNAAQSFQKMMDYVLAGIPNIFVYLDDILIFNDTEEEHLQTLDTLFRTLDENDLTISLKKCQFNAEELDFLGYKVNGDGIAPINKKLQAIIDFPTPTRPRELLGFLGAVNYYRRCLPKVGGLSPADILQPLYKAATQKTPKQKFTDTWKLEKLDEPYLMAKQMLAKACMLVHPDPAAILAVTTDSSATSIGGVLEQYTNGRWEPLGFFSRHLKPNEVAWSTFKRELYALQQSLRHFMAEIDGRNVICFTDHKPIVGAFQNPSALDHDHVAKAHLIEVSQWTQDVRYVTGKSNVVADALSRPASLLGTAYSVPNSMTSDGPSFDLETETRQITEEIAALCTTIDQGQLAKDQQTCPDVQSHRAGQHATGLLWADVEFQPGLFLFCEVSVPSRPRPLLPQNHRQQVMELYHSLNHPGKRESIKKIAHNYFWPAMKADISQYVTNCIPCNRCKSQPKIKPPMVPRPILQPRFQHVEVDVVGPLPSSEGQTHLLTIVDRTSRWFEAVPMPEATAAQCCQAFIRGWVRNFGVPANIESDNGNTFDSKLWNDVQAQLGSIVKYTPLYSPQALGGVERQHRDLKHGLKTALLQMGDEKGSAWMQVLPWTLLARRTSFHNELQGTPAEAVLGENPKLPGDITPQSTPDETLAQMMDRMRLVADRPPAQSRPSVEKPHFPDKADNATHVYVRKPKSKTKPLGPISDGPYVILERLGNSCLNIQTGHYKSGAPRTEIVHWRNCYPAVLPVSTTPAVRPPLGRKPRQHSTTAPAASPRIQQSVPSDNTYTLRPRKPISYRED